MFEFYFTFADGCGQSLLKIERDGENFKWSFRLSERWESNTMVLSEFGVYDNLRNIVNLLHYNASMYSHFEFFAPGFPRVLVNMADAFSAIPYIEHTMFSLIRNIKPEVSQSVEYQSMARPFGYLAHKKPEEDEVVDDEEDEDADDEDADDEDADDEAYDSEDQYADMPPLISVDHCPCTPNRRTTRTCPQLPKRFEKNEIVDDGPCNNTRSAKRSRLNNSQSVPSHLFFD